MQEHMLTAANKSLRERVRYISKLGKEVSLETRTPEFNLSQRFVLNKNGKYC
jgi:hypothetical protein